MRENGYVWFSSKIPEKHSEACITNSRFWETSNETATNTEDRITNDKWKHFIQKYRTRGTEQAFLL